MLMLNVPFFSHSRYPLAAAGTIETRLEMKKIYGIFLMGFLALTACSKPDGDKAFDELVFIDHQNLRQVVDRETTLFQVNSIKKNMDKAADYGIDTYLLFAKDTFEAMLNYDFEIDGIGNIGQQAFALESQHRQTGEYLRESLQQVLDHAQKKNLRVFYHSNQFIFPREVLQVIKPAVWGTAVCPGRDITWMIYRQKLNEFLTMFPAIAGFQVTGDETQVSVLECACDSCRHLSFVDRVNLLTAETAKVCEAHGKEVQMRTWQRMGELEAEKDPSHMGDGLPGNVFFSIKNTRGDFLLTNPVDIKFLKAADPNRIVVEFDGWREYTGNNYFPCYMGDIWAPRFKLLQELGIRRVAVRLNWNSGKNPIFERPWGNVINIYLFLKLAEQPQRPADEILTEYIESTFPESACAAAFELYKFSPQFQQAIYHIDGDYWANHSRVQDEDAREDLAHAQRSGYLTKAEHFLERQEEIDVACNIALSLIDRLGPDLPQTHRKELIEGVYVEKSVALGNIYKLEALYWKAKDNKANLETVKNRLLDLQREWQSVHPESYQSMNGRDLTEHY